MHACTKDLTKQGRQFLHFEHWESQCLGMQESAALFYKACFACMHVANLGQTWPVPSRPGQSRPVPAPVLSRPSPVPSARLSRPVLASLPSRPRALGGWNKQRWRWK